MPNKAKDIAVSAKGQIVGISDGGYFIYREGRHSECSNRGNWIITSSAVALSRISIGGAGIWAVDVGDGGVYRPGSIGDNGIIGTEWENIDGSWQTVSVGTFFVIGVNSQSIWRRDGVNESTPGGSTWEDFPGSWVEVDTTEGACYVWGIKEDDSIYLGTFH
ncbi:tectonin beta-propeller repeat-containing protein 1-like [Littorina saxatilis]|uniref:tectonin beta-propeller repeat-containing protein 1-like n=1 Tax=Littorina saxatilis TaxID=31220 RepID=UPI0038B6B0B5